MATLATVLLRHETVDGCHYDWLLERPDRPEGALWTARATSPTWCWLAALTWDLQVIADHRRDYLTREGPLSGGRGRVRRVDAGVVTVQDWSAERIAFDLAMRHCRGTVELIHIAGDRWRAALQS